MTAASGLRILIIGALAVIASCAPLGTAIYQLAATRPVVAVPPAAEGEFAASALQLTPERGARLVFDLAVRTASLSPSADSGSRPRARYRFPITYRIHDGSGELLSEQEFELDWLGDDNNSTRRRQNVHEEYRYSVEADGARLGLRSAFRAFEVPESGLVSVSASLGPDSTYAAVVERASLEIEHDILDPVVVTIFGVFLFVGGWVTAVIGCVMLVAAELPAPVAEAVSTPAGEAEWRLAAVCHIAGFAGLLVPLLGNILGPLIAWMMWRRQHPYIDQQGREALNFQLSILVYMLLSFALALILIGLLMIPLLWLFQVAMMIVAALRTSEGKPFKYPLTLRFVP